jgi:hypothetical protein
VSNQSMSSAATRGAVPPKIAEPRLAPTVSGEKLACTAPAF